MEENKGNNQTVDSNSVTASLGSETFESWTLIADSSKNDDEIATKVVDDDNDDNKVEIIKEKELEDDNKHVGNQDKENGDDFSDGISVISDSESAGRESPQPLSRNIFIHTINPLEFHLIKESIPCELLTPPRTPLRESDIYTVSSASNTEDNVQEPEQESQLQRNIFQIQLPFRRFAMSGLVLLSAFVALVAFIAKLKYPEWYVSTQIDPLKQRVEDLELRNNLLRAEIDLLAKQVNYISQEGNKIKNKKPQKYEERWSSDEDISKENSPDKESKAPNPGTSSEHKVKSNGNTKTAGSLNDGSDDSIKTEQFTKTNVNQMKNSAPTTHEQWDYKNPKQFDEKSFDDKKYHRKGENSPPKYKDDGHYEERKYDKNYKKYNSGERFDDEFKKKGKYKLHYKGNINLRKDSSKERYEHPNNKHSSEESKENFKDYKRKDDRNHHYEYDEDWHEKLMQNRENLRQKSGKYETDNWYIERANNREETRSHLKKDQKYRD